MKNHTAKIRMNLLGSLAAALVLGFGCPLYAGTGDNQDDPKSGKIDQSGDGNSGQGDDLHKGHGKFGKDSNRKGDPDGRCDERHKGMRDRLLKKFDANGDGKLDDAERAKAREAFHAKKKEMIKRFDADGDGKLSPEEREKAKDAMIQEHFQEFSKNHPEAAKRFDKNGDGRLSKDELEAAREQWKSKRDGKVCKPGSERRDKASGEGSRHYPKGSREYPSDQKETHSDNGVRDWGEGEGRDDAGQGKGKGRGPDRFKTD